MSDLTVIQSSRLPADGGQLARDVEQLRKICTDLWNVRYRGWDHLGPAEVALAAAEDLQKGGSLDRVRQHLLAPACDAHVQKSLVLLIAAYPNAPKGDLKVFGRMLLEDVLAAQPSAIVLDEACRALRRTSRFLPTIAETLEAIETQRMRFAVPLLEDLNRHMAEVRGILERRRAVGRDVAAARARARA